MMVMSHALPILCSANWPFIETPHPAAAIKWAVSGTSERQLTNVSFGTSGSNISAEFCTVISWLTSLEFPHRSLKIQFLLKIKGLSSVPNPPLLLIE